MPYPKISITFLGTGTSTGIPMIGCHCEVCTSPDSKDKRLRSSILIRSGNTTVVVDTTPDFRYQMLRIANEDLDGVLFTHPHKDHIAGLDDVRPYNFFLDKPVHVYANALTIKALKNEFSYVFSDHKYPGIPEIELFEISDQPFTVGDLDILPVQVWHHKMPVTAFRFGKFTYITDANRIEATEKEKIKGSEILVVNALRKEHHISHFTLDQAIKLVDELQVKEAWFTHISHQLGKHEEVSKDLPPNIHLAFDGLQLEL